MNMRAVWDHLRRWAESAFAVPVIQAIISEWRRAGYQSGPRPVDAGGHPVPLSPGARTGPPVDGPPGGRRSRGSWARSRFRSLARGRLCPSFTDPWASRQRHGIYRGMADFER